ncbi:hypothetical protein C4552_04320 [Candidatus Parcubacteria bacterium]|nr:MAG: hypothetical protein C4552_04320 [Candidatus Parcubacteria bacterium]
MAKVLVGLILGLAAAGGVWWFVFGPEEISTSNTPPPPPAATGTTPPPAAQAEPAYPDDFVLRSGEIPAQFILAPIDEETLAMGVTGNPGYITDPQFIQFAIGEDVDIAKVDKVYLIGYTMPGAELGEMGMYVVRFKSEADLASQIAKLPPAANNNLEYYRRGRVLVIVWSALEAYASERAAVGTIMTGRLGMSTVAR